MTRTTLVLVRHGQTEANLNHRIDTHLPGSPLTGIGRAQVAALAEVLADPGSALRRTIGAPVDAVYSSAAVRGVESAAVLAARLGLTPTRLKGVQEIAAGEFDGRTDPEARDGYLAIYARWQRGELDVRQPGGESGRAALDRLLPALGSLADRHRDGVALLVGHAAAVELATTALCANVDGEFAVVHPLPSCATVVLVREEGRWRCIRWADVPLPAGAADGYDPGAYELNWPPEIFAAEAEALVDAPGNVVRHLLDEAFTGPRPATDGWALRGHPRSAAELLRRLIADAPTLRRAAKLRVDHALDTPDPVLLERLTRELVGKLDGYGYLDQAEPGERSRVLAAADGVPRLIEDVHALVARPRHRDPGPGHPRDFSPETGRALYRAHTDRNLRRAGFALRLAATPHGSARLVPITAERVSDGDRSASRSG